MLSVEGIGKNIEQAIENALFELKAPREDVDIKILSEGGLFKKAKVLVTISEDAREKYEKKAKKVEEPAEEVKVEKEEKKTAKAEEKEIKKAEKEAEKETKKAEKQEEKEEDEEDVDHIETTVDLKEFLEGFLKVAGKENFQIEVKEDEKYITYVVEGENLGDLIGHRGEAFYALNRLLSAMAGRKSKRVLLDIGGYREKRVETLTQLAFRTANKVAKTGRYARLDPMNPADRRIIHTALQNDGRVSTLSKGEEPKRYVMIFPTDTE